MSWSILPTLVVRTTGFPFELIERLSFGRSVALVRAILACETERAALRRELLEQRFPAAVQQAQVVEQRAWLVRLSGWRRAVGRLRAVEMPPNDVLDQDFIAALSHWNALLERHAALLVEGHAAFASELAERRQTLWTSAAQPDVQEAILLSSPSMYAALQRYLADGPAAERTSAVRKFERRLVFYLQRLCIKNETQSFFGPINYGRLDPTQPANLQLRRAGGLRQRAAFASHWLAETLASVIGGTPELRPWLRPRRGTVCVARANRQLWFPTSGRMVALDQASARLFELADGRRTVLQLAEALDEDWTATWARLARLQRVGAISVALHIPGDVSDPLAIIQRWLDELPPSEPGRRWSAALQELRGLIAAFATADLDRRVQLLSTIEERWSALQLGAAWRGAGEMYADRALLFEECLGDIEQCVIGGALATTIQSQLRPVLQLAQVYGRLLQQRDQRLAQAIWQRLPRTEAGGVPLLPYLQACAQATLPPTTPDELDRWLAVFETLVVARSDGHVARLTSVELPLPALPTAPDDCAYSAPDLLIAAPNLAAVESGQFQLILGEVHPQPLTWVFPTAYFIDGHDPQFATMLHRALVAQPGGALAAQIVLNRRGKIFPYALPGPSIEMRPLNPDCDAIPAAALEVRAHDGQLRLWTTERWLRLYTPLKRRADGVDAIAALAFPAVQPPPIDIGAHTPRIEIDGLVYQRERWRLPGGALSDLGARHFDLLLQIWRWKQAAGLPDRVFVRAPQEPKPFFVDFTNPFLVELLDSVARQSASLMLTEMLPRPDQLWLAGAHGRHCCELRAVAVVR